MRTGFAGSRGALGGGIGIIAVACAAVGFATRDATWTAAAAAGATGLVIVWQSWASARAAEAAEQGLTQSQEAVDRAQASLEVAQASLRVSQVLAIEAERARLDASGPPFLHVSFGRPTWPPWVREGPNQGMALLDPARVFHLPRDQKVQLVLRAEGTLTNPSDRAVRVGLYVTDHALVSGTLVSEPGGWFLLGPNTELRLTLEEAKTIDTWKLNYEAWQRNEPNVAKGVGEVIVDDGADNGVHDRYPIEVGGNVLQPAEGFTEAWRLHDPNPDGQPAGWATVRPRERVYFRSKVGNQRLPALAVEIADSMPADNHG